MGVSVARPGTGDGHGYTRPDGAAHPLMRPEDLAKTLDQLILDPSATEADVTRAVEDARAHHLAALSTLPEFTPLVADALRGADVKACAVIGYPAGALGWSEKVRQAEEAVAAGAAELDIIMNAEALLAGELLAARDDVARVVRAVRSRAANSGRGDVLVKVVVQAGVLGDKLTRLACKIVADAGADFAQTCVGDGPPATIQQVELMRDALPEQVAVSAAGRLETFDDVAAMIGAGAARVCTPSAAAVMRELAARNGEA